MRYLQLSLILMLSSLFVGPVRAEDDSAEAKGDRPGHGEFRQKMLEEFDADGDGELSDDERKAAREAMRGRRDKDGAKGRRGGHGGEGPPDPEQLFEKFDADGDNQLSREEFRELAEAMHERHAKHRGERGRHGEGRGHGRRSHDAHGDRPGSPRKGRRDFHPPKTLQNPSDRQGHSPRSGKGRRGGGQRGGSGTRGIEGRRPPNPDKVFDRFDENSDGQLSRGEFMELSKAMREMHARFGREGGKKYGKGRGDRRGSHSKGVHDRKRPPRPDSEDGDGLE